MTRALAGVLVVAALAAALVACPRAGGEVAKPVPVELDWPDAAVPGDRGDAGPVVHSGA